MAVSSEDRTICFLRALQREDGGYVDNETQAASGLQDTVSALKALRLLCAGPKELQKAFGYVLSCANDAGGFAREPDGAPGAYWTAFGLIALRELGEIETLRAAAARHAQFMYQNATSAPDYFMVIAAHEECGVLGSIPEAAISFFQSQVNEEGTFGGSVHANAIACSALLRSGSEINTPEPIIRGLLSAQRPDGGFAEVGNASDLLTTYLVMRALLLLNAAPNLGELRRYIRKLSVTSGGYASTIGGTPSASATYQSHCILQWIDDLSLSHPKAIDVRDTASAVDSARAGDVATLRMWLTSGGNPNTADSEGWTPLLAAAARGQVRTVELLLYHDLPGAQRASPNVRFAPADALPIYMAAQAGDFNTVKMLLRSRPQHIFDVAGVNGHTVLLQAVFYGFPEHAAIARYLLDNIAEILCLPNESKAAEDARKRLLVATNVRGFNALGMSQLWRNQMMIELLETYPQPTEAERMAYFEELLTRISPREPESETERAAQAVADGLFFTIQAGLKGIAEFPPHAKMAAEAFMDGVLTVCSSLMQHEEFDIRRLAGPLQQPPIVAAATGRNANEHAATLRIAIVKFLLDNGADPDQPELHPMAVDAVIRAAVLDHLDLLELFGNHMEPKALTAAMNVRPAVNGQTALHDTVHRALTAPPDVLSGLLRQIHWMVAHGALSDIEDHTGKTPEEMARGGLGMPTRRKSAQLILQALGVEAQEHLSSSAEHV
ncbi:ankyrin repeat domain-containing protein [Sinorhizobium meliloti]|uniref:ankyrin repeat domain-containing protein n=1 Tax=Rhizobium meliloti TaxID=382 RepID=UPI000FD824B8|nr:ankyrin repeat domain-containing protein [Sinorhizobium meliloti]RVE91071.1 hypothetical protein CN238_08355 [Sinorhizobium meliloti]RVH34158.1 hypothetical protein CN214_07455 [Sinorhizobium meliloti]